MTLKMIAAEYRPSIQSVFFLIRVSSRLFEASERTQLILTEDCISIAFDKFECYKINLNNRFKIITNSLSSLIIEPYSITFRMNTNPGLFTTEVLDLSRTIINRSSEKIKCNKLRCGDPYSFVCTNCLAPLANNYEFKRVLELPIGKIDLNHWFCHASEDAATLKEPDETELFYSLTFVLVNRTKFSGLIENGEHLHCIRCLQCLGEISDSAYKFWTDTVRIDQSDGSVVVGNNNLDSFKALILTMLEQQSFSAPTGLLTNMKILFSSYFCNSNTSSYIFLQVIDKSMLTFIGKAVTKPEANMPVEYRMEDRPSIKVLYKHSVKALALTEFWLSDPNVQQLKISAKMFVSVVDYLRENGDGIPLQLQKSDDFSVSFIYL